MTGGTCLQIPAWCTYKLFEKLWFSGFDVKILDTKPTPTLKIWRDHNPAD